MLIRKNFSCIVKIYIDSGSMFPAGKECRIGAFMGYYWALMRNLMSINFKFNLQSKIFYFWHDYLYTYRHVRIIFSFVFVAKFFVSVDVSLACFNFESFRHLKCIF